MNILEKLWVSGFQIHNKIQDVPLTITEIRGTVFKLQINPIH